MIKPPDQWFGQKFGLGHTKKSGTRPFQKAKNVFRARKSWPSKYFGWTQMSSKKVCPKSGDYKS